MFLMVLVTFLGIPMASYAETGQKCASDCVNKCSSLVSDKEYVTCLENCLSGCYDKPTGIPDVPPPTPARHSKEESDLNSSAETGTEEENTNKNIAASSVFDDSDQPCYVGGKVAGYCSLNNPYLNVLNATCYSTLQDCKKADGDLATAPGYGGCVRCGK